MNTFTLKVQELRLCKLHSLSVNLFSTVNDVKELLYIELGVPPSRQQLFQSSWSIPLCSSLTLHCLQINDNGHVIHLSIIDDSVIGSANFVLNHAQETSLDEECSGLLLDIREGIMRNVPIRTDVLDCTGGVYFMRAASGRKIAVFKPADEELGMINNAKGYTETRTIGNQDSTSRLNTGLRQFIKPGYGCMREVAAYIMDSKNFCNVPATMLVHCEHSILNYPERDGLKSYPHPKLGSLQKFCNASGSFEDIGPSILSDFELQKIALFDLRLLNCDRNSSNILIKRKDVNEQRCTDNNIPGYGGCSDAYTLIPIDHGLCFPSRLLVYEIDWAWLHCPHIKKPVHEDIKQYLQDLDIDELLSNVVLKVRLSSESLFLAKIVHLLVKDAVTAGLTLYDIAMIIARTSEDIPSPLEKAIEEAEENAHRTIEMRVSTIKRPIKIEKFEKDISPNYSTTKRHRNCGPIFPSKALKTSSLSSNDLEYTPQNIGIRYMFENPDLKIIEGVTSSEESGSSSGTNTPNIGSSYGNTPNIGSSCFTNTPNIASPCGANSPNIGSTYGTNTPNIGTNSPNIGSSSGGNACNIPCSSGPNSTNTSCKIEENVVCTLGDDFVRTVAEDLVRTIEEEALSNSHVPISSLMDDKHQPATFETSHIPFANIDESLENRIGFPIISENHFFSVASAVRKLSDLSVSDNPSPSFPEEPKREAIVIPTVAKRELILPFKEPDNMHLKRTLSHRQLSSTSNMIKSSRTLMSTSSDTNDYEMGEGDSPLSSPSSMSSDASDISFMRVTSFSAFSSAPNYDTGSAERRIGKLRKERRQEVITTEEFTRLRFDFSRNSLTALVSKLIKKK